MFSSINTVTRFLILPDQQNHHFVIAVCHTESNMFQKKKHCRGLQINSEKVDRDPAVCQRLTDGPKDPVPTMEPAPNPVLLPYERSSLHWGGHRCDETLSVVPPPVTAAVTRRVSDAEQEHSLSESRVMHDRAWPLHGWVTVKHDRAWPPHGWVTVKHDRAWPPPGWVTVEYDRVSPPHGWMTVKHDRASPPHGWVTVKHDRASPLHGWVTVKHDRASPSHGWVTVKHDRASPLHGWVTVKHDRAWSPQGRVTVPC